MKKKINNSQDNKTGHTSNNHIFSNVNSVPTNGTVCHEKLQ